MLRENQVSWADKIIPMKIKEESNVSMPEEVLEMLKKRQQAIDGKEYRTLHKCSQKKWN